MYYLIHSETCVYSLYPLLQLNWQSLLSITACLLNTKPGIAVEFKGQFVLEEGNTA